MTIEGNGLSVLSERSTEGGKAEVFEDEADVLISCTGTHRMETSGNSRIRE